MALKKSKCSNIIFFGIIGIIIITYLTGPLHTVASKIRMTVFPPSVENTKNRVVVEDYKWDLKGINTEDFNFENAKEKVVFVNFWATWCPPCRAEMQSIQNLYDDYKNEVIFIFQTDEKPTVVKDFLTKKKYSLPSYNIYTNPPTEFTVSSIPATYLLNKKGEIVIHKVGAANWNSDKMRKLLDELIAE